MMQPWHVIVILTGLLMIGVGVGSKLVSNAASVSKSTPAILDITCYSCGGVIYENKVDVEDYSLPDSGGIRFLDKKTNSWVNLGGDCIVKVIK